MLEGKSEKLEVSRDVELIPLKNKMSKNKTKWGTKRNERMRRKRDEWKDNEKWSFTKWSLVKITLKHNLGLFYPFFRNLKPRPTLRTWKVHFDWTWTLGLKSFLPWEIFHNQQGCCLFSSAKILDKPFTCSGWIFECIIGQSKNEKIKT